MLCDTCQAIFQGESRGEYEKNRHEVDHHFSPLDLERSASQLCFLCEELWGAFLTQHDSIRPLKDDTEGLISSYVDMGVPRRATCHFTRYDMRTYGGDDESPPIIELTFRISRHFFTVNYNQAVKDYQRTFQIEPKPFQINFDVVFFFELKCTNGNTYLLRVYRVH